MDREVAVLAAVRTPTGKIPGELAYIEDTKLLAAVFRSAAKAADGFPIDMAVAGCAFPVEKDNLCRKGGFNSRYTAGGPCLNGQQNLCFIG